MIWTAPPENLDFETRRELVDYATQYATENGYHLKTTSSRADRVQINCIQGGSYRKCIYRPGEEIKRRPNSSTCLVGCPFKLMSRLIGSGPDRGLWKIIITKVHIPALSRVCGHLLVQESYHQKFQRASDRLLQTESAIGTFSTRFDQNSLVSSLDQSMSETCGKSSEWRSLGDRPLWRYFSNDSRHLAITTRLNWIQTQISASPPKFVVTVSENGSTQNATFAFLSRKEVEDYMWALQQLSSLLDGNVPGRFPSSSNLLCRWHISKNVGANVKPIFTGAGAGQKFETFLKEWIAATYSKSSKEFTGAMSRLQSSYLEHWPAAVSYIEKWLEHKERFVDAWTDEKLHLANTATSRVEGNHSVVKTYLKQSNNDLLGAFQY